MPACSPAQPATDVTTILLHLMSSSACFLPTCSDTAVLLDKVGQAEAAVDYATGALVNAQVGYPKTLG